MPFETTYVKSKPKQHSEVTYELDTDEKRLTADIARELIDNCRPTSIILTSLREIRINYGPEITLGIAPAASVKGTLQFFISDNENITNASWLDKENNG